jgi:phage terminase small subunit
MAGRKKSESIKPRERKYLKGLVNGKSKKDAALDAGYSMSMAENAAAKIEKPNVQRAFQEMIRKHIPDEKIVQRLKEGLDAEETKFFQHEGNVQEERNVISWGERRNYLELAAKFGGYYIDKKEIDVRDVTQEFAGKTAEELDFYADHGKWPESRPN